MKTYIIAAILFVLSACDTTDPNKGKPVDVNAPQAIEQCKAQPQLAWCKP